jgi:hypothetical protein
MKKIAVYFIVLLLIVMILLPEKLQAANNGEKPLNATNVELVKKVFIRSPQGKGKPSRTVATGILGEPCKGNKYAIVIGISDYPGTENDLNYADDDAMVVNTTLTEIYGFKNIYSLIDKNATYDNILTAINDVKGKVTPSDEVVFFFSGHGMKGIADDKDKEKIDEAIAVNSDDNTKIVPIWDGELRDWFSNWNTSRIIFVFDSCVAGGMTDLASAGRVINMACSENGVAYEGAQWGGGHGQFTYYFIYEGMFEGYAEKDTTTDAIDVTVEEAFDYASANCTMQSPVISDQFPDDLYLK